MAACEATMCTSDVAIMALCNGGLGAMVDQSLTLVLNPFDSSLKSFFGGGGGLGGLLCSDCSSQELFGAADLMVFMLSLCYRCSVLTRGSRCVMAYTVPNLRVCISHTAGNCHAICIISQGWGCIAIATLAVSF